MSSVTRAKRRLIKFCRFSGRRIPTIPKSRKTMSPSFVTNRLPGCGIAVEETVFEDHLEIGMESPHTDLMRVQSHPVIASGLSILTPSINSITITGGR